MKTTRDLHHAAVLGRVQIMLLGPLHLLLHLRDHLILAALARDLSLVHNQVVASLWLRNAVAAAEVGGDVLVDLVASGEHWALLARGPLGWEGLAAAVGAVVLDSVAHDGGGLVGVKMG